MILTDAERFSYFSHAAIRFFHPTSQKGAVGTPIFDWIAPEMRSEVKARVLRLIRTAAPAALALLFPLQRNDGMRLYTETSLPVLTDPKGRPAGMISILRYVTARVAVKNSLRSASVQLDLLSSVTRHDILNKIAILLGCIRPVRQACDPEAIHNFISEIDEIAGMPDAYTQFTRDYQDMGVSKPNWQSTSAFIF